MRSPFASGVSLVSVSSLASLASLMSLVIVGCGAPAPTPEGGGGDLGFGDSSTSASPNAKLWAPSGDGELDVRVVHAQDEDHRALMKTTGGKRLVYLNAHGGKFTPGWDDSSKGKSSIIDGPVSIPAYRKGAARFATLQTCVAKEYARWNITVTDQDPGSMPHVEAVIGGQPSAVGLPSSVGGVAPMSDDGSVIEKAVVYVFSQNLYDDTVECEVVAHEVGHALGLEHEYLCQDPMTYLEGCGHKVFQDRSAPCGTDDPVACRNGGKQNTVQHLTKVLGVAGALPNGDGDDGGNDDSPAPKPKPKPPAVDDSDDSGDTTGGDEDGSTLAAPAVSIVSPADEASFPAHSTLSVVADAHAAKGTKLTEVALRWTQDGTMLTVPCDQPISGISCAKKADKYTFTIQAGVGERTFAVQATDAAGHTSRTAERTLSLVAAPPPPLPPPVIGNGSGDDGDTGDTDDSGGSVSTGAMALTFDAPSDRAKVHAGSKLAVRMHSQHEWATVWVVWTGPLGEQRFPMRPDKKGDGWSLQMPILAKATPGKRTLTLYAADVDGKIVAGPTRTVLVR